MSIAINSNPERDQYQAAGGQTVFNFSFPIFDETYIKVYQRAASAAPNDANDILTLGVDYTVTGVGEEAGGFITLTVGATANDIVTLVGEEPIDRESVFTDYNPFTVALNQQLNEQTVMAQQTYTYWNDVTPRYYFSELVSENVRPLKRFLPMLPDGHVWVGRGEIGDTPDDITTALFTGGGGGSDCCTADIVQPPGGPTLSLGDWVRINVQGVDAVPGAYVPALATNAHLGERIGVVVEISATPDHYTIQQSGYIADTSALFPALQTGSPYYLDTVTPGNMVLDDVVLNGQASVPCFIPDSPTSGWIVPYRGILVNGPSNTGGGSGGGDTNTHTIDQPGNTFVEGDWVYVSGDTTYSLTDATTMPTSQSVGVVITPGDPLFTIQFAGWNNGAVTSAVDSVGAPQAIVSSTVYYLSSVVPGAITDTVPNDVFSKPVFISESSTDQTGWILPQRPLDAEEAIPGASPLVFLGRLDTNNSFSDPNILVDANGNTYNGYQLFIQNASLPAGGINASGAGLISIGLQLYIGGYITTGYNCYTSGISSVELSNVGVAYSYVKNDALAESLYIIGEVSDFMSLSEGTLFLSNNSGSHLLTFTCWGQDINAAPSVGYTTTGTSGDTTPGVATGLRVWVGNGGTLDVLSGGYISVYGISNS